MGRRCRQGKDTFTQVEELVGGNNMEEKTCKTCGYRCNSLCDECKFYDVQIAISKRMNVENAVWIELDSRKLEFSVLEFIDNLILTVSSDWCIFNFKNRNLVR